MKKQKKIIEDMTKQVVKKIVDQEVCEWPPQCAVFYYQPIRPSKKREIEPGGEQCTENVLAHIKGELF